MSSVHDGSMPSQSKVDERERSYNGWPNYETWLVALWLGNDPGTYTLARELVTSASSEYEAGEALKAFVEESSPLAESQPAGLHVDLLNAALTHVEWPTVARHFMPEGQTHHGS